MDDGEISIEKKVESLNLISKDSIKSGILDSFHRHLTSQNKEIGIDQPLEFGDLILFLRKKIHSIGKDITEVYYNQYCAIGFKSDTEFASMKIRPKSKDNILFLKFGEFEPSLEKFEKFQIKRLPNKFNYANKIFRVSITKKEQINEIIELVKQYYELQLK